MNPNKFLSSLILVIGLTISLSACKKPVRESLGKEGIPVYDIVTAIQNRDHDLFTKMVVRGSDAEQNFGSLSQFQKLCDAFLEKDVTVDGWSMLKNENASEVLKSEVESENDTRVVRSRTERVAYDIKITIKRADSTKAERFVGRVYAEGKNYRQFSKNDQGAWVETTSTDPTWKVVKITSPGLTPQ